MGEAVFKNRGEQVFGTLKREILDLALKPVSSSVKMIYAAASASPGHRCGML